MDRTFSTILNCSGESGHSSLTPNHRKIAFNFSFLHTMSHPLYTCLCHSERWRLGSDLMEQENRKRFPNNKRTELNWDKLYASRGGKQLLRLNSDELSEIIGFFSLKYTSLRISAPEHDNHVFITFMCSTLPYNRTISKEL